MVAESVFSPAVTNNQWQQASSIPVLLKVGGIAPKAAILRGKGAKQHKGGENAQPLPLIDHWVNDHWVKFGCDLTALQWHAEVWCDCLVVCPLTKFKYCIEQWHMAVIVAGYTLFVTSQYDGILAFANQRFGEVCWHNCILFYTHCPYSLLYNVLLWLT